jgi:hypothetical protein
MLYDPKWEQQTKADPLKIETLIAWLEKQRPSARYNYECTGRCLLALYFQDMGFTNICVGPNSLSHGTPRVRIKLPEQFDAIAIGPCSGPDDWTFGAALGRARKLAAA